MKNGILWIILGIISIIGGFMAIANPVIATLTATTIAAYIFIFVGVIQFVSAFSTEGTGAKIWTLILGVVAVFLGISLLGHPLKAVVALTTVVAIMFVVGGIAKIVLAFSLEDKSYFWLILISGLVSLFLGGFILANFMEMVGITLGLLLGVELLSNGISLIVMGAALRKTESEA